MNFETYLKQSWKDHGSQPEKVAAEFSAGASLVRANEELGQLVGLVTHVMGEHLRRWSEGISLLHGLSQHAALVKGSETEGAINRSIAALKVGEGSSPELNSFSLSDQVRILAVASSALASTESERGQDLLRQALKLAECGLEKSDPANRALAVTGNNLACSLEEKKSRAPAETELMILSSQTARKFWEIAGGWLEVSRAEYRLAMTYIQAGQFEKAHAHALECLRLCRENGAGSLDMFFAFEALAIAESKLGNAAQFEASVAEASRYFELLPEADKSWCASSLKKLLNSPL